MQGRAHCSRDQTADSFSDVVQCWEKCSQPVVDCSIQIEVEGQLKPGNVSTAEAVVRVISLSQFG